MTMTDKYPGVYRGPAGPECITENDIAAGAIPIGAPVKLTTAGTGEEAPRVQTTATTTDPIIGIVVDGEYRGTYGGVDTSVTPNPSNSANAAGQGVVVVKFGRAKVVVDGSTASIAIGDPLCASTIGTGFMQKATIGTDYVIARAKQASTAYGDIILAEVRPEGI